nr:taste receptor type 2 member 10-like [Pogona vitticeps]
MVAEIMHQYVIVTWVIVAILCSFALLGNGFIIVVKGYQWFQQRKMIPSDFLLTCLSSSRVLALLTGELAFFLGIATSETYKHTRTEEFLNFSSFFFDINSIWCATWLSVLYCVKVTNFANPFLLWLKPRINLLAPRLLGISVIVSMVVSVPSFIRYSGYKRRCNLTGDLPMNTSERMICNNLFSLFRPVRFGLVSINFSLSAVSTILLLTSLWRHITNLRKTGAGMKDVSTQVHINVMKPLVFFLFCYLSYFMGNGFIIVVNGYQWFQQRKMIPSDFLLTCLSSSRVLALLSTVSTILLLTSLWRHITNLRKSGAGMKDVSTQVHINVMKPLVFYLFCYLSYFMVLGVTQEPQQIPAQ